MLLLSLSHLSDIVVAAVSGVIGESRVTISACIHSLSILLSHLSVLSLSSSLAEGLSTSFDSA